MNDLMASLAIPMGVLVSIFVQTLKVVDIPKSIVQGTVIFVSLGLAFLAQYNAGLFNIVVEGISTAGVAFMTYETVIKRIFTNGQDRKDQ